MPTSRRPFIHASRACRVLRDITGDAFLSTIRERRRRDGLSLRGAIASLIRDARKVSRWVPAA